MFQGFMGMFTKNRYNKYKVKDLPWGNEQMTLYNGDEI